jgi:hypothetical protein
MRTFKFNVCKMSHGRISLICEMSDQEKAIERARTESGFVVTSSGVRISGAARSPHTGFHQ